MKNIFLHIYGIIFDSIFLFNWNSSLNVFERLTAVSFFGALSLLPFYLFEQNFIANTFFDVKFLFWVLFEIILLATHQPAKIPNIYASEYHLISKNPKSNKTGSKLWVNINSYNIFEITFSIK